MFRRLFIVLTRCASQSQTAAFNDSPLPVIVDKSPSVNVRFFFVRAANRRRILVKSCYQSLSPMHCPNCYLEVPSRVKIFRGTRCRRCNAVLLVSPAYARTLVLLSLVSAWVLLWFIDVS